MRRLLFFSICARNDYKQVDSSQQAQRAMTFVRVIPREGRVDAGLGRQIGCSGCDGLDSRLLVVRNDRHSLGGFARLGGGSLQMQKSCTRPCGQCPIGHADCPTVARCAHSSSSPAPLARRFAAVGLDPSARPNKLSAVTSMRVYGA